MEFYWKTLENVETNCALKLSQHYIDIVHSPLIHLFTESFVYSAINGSQLTPSVNKERQGASPFSCTF